MSASDTTRQVSAASGVILPFQDPAIDGAQPLRNLDVMLAFFRGTITTAGLKVEADLDQGIYRKGRKVTDRQLKDLALSTHDICPRWNYTLTPRPLQPPPLKEARRIPKE
jgi:hypothetical protein